VLNQTLINNECFKSPFLFAPTLEHGADFSVSLIILQMVWLLGRVISSFQGLYLNTGQHKHGINTYTYRTSMPCMGFEPTIPASQWPKTVHTLDSSDTVTGGVSNHLMIIIHAKIFLFYSHSGGWSPAGSTRQGGHWLALPRVIMMMENLMEWRLAGETEAVGEKNRHRVTLSTTNPTWQHPGSNPGRRGGKPTTNCLSYGAATRQNMWLL
jgi:hypothetical protein